MKDNWDDFLYEDTDFDGEISHIDRMITMDNDEEAMKCSSDYSDLDYDEEREVDDFTVHTPSSYSHSPRKSSKSGYTAPVSISPTSSKKKKPNEMVVEYWNMPSGQAKKAKIYRNIAIFSGILTFLSLLFLVEYQETETLLYSILAFFVVLFAIALFCGLKWFCMTTYYTKVVDSSGKIVKESDFTLKKKTEEHIEGKKTFLTDHNVLNRKEKIVSISRKIKADLDAIDKMMPSENQGLQKESFEIAMIGLAYFNLCKIVCSSTTKNKALKLLLDITDTKIDGKEGMYPFSDIANDKDLQNTLEVLTYGKNGVSFFDVQLAGACHTHNEQSIMDINSNFLDMMQLWAAECEEIMATTGLRTKVMKGYSDVFTFVSEKHWGKVD